MAEKQSDLYFKLGEMHADIKNTYEEAKKTNGRVTRLETLTVPELKDEVDKINYKIALYMGAIGVILFVANLVLPPLVKSLFQW